MIEIKNASTSYVKGKKIIDKMNLKIENGIVFGFIGPNGAGKTTTLEMITGVLQIDEGDIFIDGKSIKTKPIEAKKKFGFVPDSPEMFEKLTGLEYLNFIGDVYEVNPEERLEIVEKLAKKFNIYDSLKDRIQSYSHGMKQKLLIISVLLYNPKNWILDEPMTGLDPQASYTLKELMKEHSKKGNTVFFSTHVLEVAEKICDKIAIINKGKIIYTGTIEELKEQLKTDTSLEESFLELIESKEK
ncbi:MAG: ABC transporter ATP-binding protein [Clostridia bacterium]|jgi:ABC-2 type transport system ATP-binding protein|nr:ABC transporter ATP-binding protein [Clostridia bacterium]